MLRFICHRAASASNLFIRNSDLVELRVVVVLRISNQGRISASAYVVDDLAHRRKNILRIISASPHKRDELRTGYLVEIVFAHKHYGMIFSIAVTTMSEAPADFSCSITSQRTSSPTTLCIDTISRFASGTTVGLFIPGTSSLSFSTEANGAFIITYLLPRARRLLWMGINSRSISRLAGERRISSFAISTASESIMVIRGSSPFTRAVLPVERMSQVASAIFSAGVISTAPLISMIFASICLEERNRPRIPG